MLNTQPMVELAKSFSPPCIGSRVTWFLLYLKSLIKERGFKHREWREVSGVPPQVRNRRMNSELNRLVPPADQRGILAMDLRSLTTETSV